MKPYIGPAVAFTSAMVEGDFNRAYALLAPQLQQQFTEDTLRERFYAMFSSYATGEPRRIHFGEEFAQSVWPENYPGDLGWVYVGIEGDDFLEAVTVTVADVGGEFLIRHVEWGRP